MKKSTKTKGSKGSSTPHIDCYNKQSAFDTTPPNIASPPVPFSQPSEAHMSYLGPTCLLKAALKAALKEGVLYKEICSVVWVPLKSVEAMYGAYRHAHPHPCTYPCTPLRRPPCPARVRFASLPINAVSPLLHTAPYCTWPPTAHGGCSPQWPQGRGSSRTHQWAPAARAQSAPGRLA